MKRLLQSSKFWLAVIGAGVAILTWKNYGRHGLCHVRIRSFFGVGIIGNAGEDMVKTIKNKTLNSQ